MHTRQEPKTFGEVFALFGELWRENGPLGFARLAMRLGRTPSVASHWWLESVIVAVASALFVLYQLTFVGHSSFNTSSDGVNWGLAISTYVFFALISSGLTMIASLGTVFGFKQFLPIAKRCIFLAIITLVAAFSVLALELGHPFRMLWAVPTGLQTMSPMFWMGTFYAIDLGLLIIKFYLMWQEDWDSALSHAVGVAGFVAVLLASGMLGLVFGSMAMRPMWFGAFTSTYFMLTAAMCGAAAVVVTSYMAVGFNPELMPRRLREMAAGHDLPLVFATLIGLTLVMFVTRFWVGLWSNLDGLDGFHALVRTPLFHIELWIGLVLPFAMMMMPSLRTRMRPQMVASFLVLGAMFIDRYIFIIGGQLVPMFKGMSARSLVAYVPSVTEWVMALFGLSVALALYAFGEKLFNLFKAPLVYDEVVGQHVEHA